MRKFEFPLEKVLRYKRQLERLAEFEEMRARAAVAVARNQATEIEAQLARLAAAMAVGIAPFAEWSMRFELSARLGDDLQTARESLKRAEIELQKAVDARVQRGTEAESLAVLKREQWLEHRRDVARHEQARLDELGLRQTAKQRAERGGGP